MDTGEQVSLNPQPLPPRAIWLTAAVAIAVAAILAAWGTFGGDGNSTGDYTFRVGVMALVADVAIYIADQTS